MMTGGTHDGSRNPVLIIACNALPAMEKPLNRTSPTHGYADPRICPFLKPHVAHVHRRIVPSTHTGPPQLSQGLMPHETNTRRKASKLNTNAIRPMMMPAVIPGHILTLDLSAFSSSSLVYFMIQSFLLQKPVFDSIPGLRRPGKIQ